MPKQPTPEGRVPEQEVIHNPTEGFYRKLEEYAEKKEEAMEQITMSLEELISFHNGRKAQLPDDFPKDKFARTASDNFGLEENWDEEDRGLIKPEKHISALDERIWLGKETDFEEKYQAVDPAKIRSFYYKSSAGKIRIYEPGGEGEWTVTTTEKGVDRMAEAMFWKEQEKQAGQESVQYDEKAEKDFIRRIREARVTPYKK